MSRRLAVAVAAVALLLALAVGAHAYLTAGGSGGASASVASLPAPTLTATSGSSVRLSWTAVTAPGSGTVSYYVTRDGGAAAAACPGAASPTTATSCTDSAPLGRHDYTVTAVWRSWSGRSATSSATVSGGPATQLVFTTQPGGSPTGGTAFPTQPVVTARDARGNTVPDYSGTVTLTLRGGSASGVLSGCTATLANGVTSFRGCSIDRSSGTGYFLRASDGTLTVDSSTFSVSSGPLAQLVFTTQPGNGTGGSQFSTQPVVTARDAGGNTATSYNGTPALSIVPGSGTAGAALSQCDADNSNGVVTYDNCEIDRAGTGYRLRATEGAVTADSNAFNVTVGSVFDLRFTTQPSGAVGGTAFPTQPVVTAVDAGGNTVTSYSSTVSLAIRTGTGTSGATLSGCTSSRSNGVTTFSGCRIDRAGTGYQLRASDFSRQEDSSSFDVTAGPATRLAFTAQPSSATAGQTLSPAPVVVAVDAVGNAVSGYAGTVTLSVERDGSALSGCTSSVSRGATTFSGCRITRSGSGYVLHAGDGVLEGDSSSFTVSAGSVSTIAFTTQPGGGATGGATFPTQPALTAYDAFGNVATSYSSTITLTILSGGARGATLSSCSRSLSNGVTRFTSCRIDRAGTGYVLRATDTGSRTADSAAFDVAVGAAAALRLSATATPVAGVATALTVSATDAGGNPVTSYTGARTLVFSGSGRSPAGTSPTVDNGSGTAIALGSNTSLTFASGVARTTMILRDAGTADLRVDDGPFDNDDELLALTVSAGTPARLAWDGAATSSGTLSTTCLFTCTVTNSSGSATFSADVAVTDADGNVVSNLGSSHSVTLATPGSGAGSGGAFTAPSAGRSITATIPAGGLAVAAFTFRNQSGNGWSTHTFTATSSRYTSASATINN